MILWLLSYLIVLVFFVAPVVIGICLLNHMLRKRQEGRVGEYLKRQLQEKERELEPLRKAQQEADYLENLYRWRP